MADHITLNAKSFMKGHTPVNPMPNKGAKAGDMSNFTPANPHSPTGGPSAQANLVPKMSGPVKTGRGALKGVK